MGEYTPEEIRAELARRGLPDEGESAYDAGDYAAELRRRGLDVRGSIEERFRGMVGQTAAGAIETVAPLVAPVAGAARGAMAGAPLGFPGMVIGAGLGGMAGGGVNVLGTDILRGMEGQPPLTTMQALTEMGEQGIAGMGGQVLGTAMAGGLRLLKGGTTKLRQIAANAAKNLGVELTAAEQTGSRAMTVAENLTKRSLGAGPFDAMGRRKSMQAIGAAENIVGPLPEAAQSSLRSNKFMGLMEKLREGFKERASNAFRAYERAVGGPQQELTEDMLPSFFATTAELEGGQSILPALRSGKMGALYEQIKEFRAGMTSSIRVKPQHEAAIRKLMGLRPDEPLDAANLPIFSNPQFAQFLETVPAKLPTLAQIRQIRSDLGELAFPPHGVTDPASAPAARLWGALADDLEAHAAARGGLALLQESNQMYRVDLAQLDKKIYANLLAGAKSLPDVSKTLFNPRSQDVLLDAKSILTEDGWKMIQQQYADDVFLGSNFLVPLETGGWGVKGRALGDRLIRDRRVLEVLHPPETVKALMEFAEVVKIADPMSSIMRGDIVGLFISAGQGAAIATGVGLMAGGNIAGGAISTALALVPYGFSKLATSPLGIKLLTNTIKAANAGRGYLSSELTQTLAHLAAKGVTSAAAPGLNPYRTDMPITTPGMTQ